MYTYILVKKYPDYNLWAVGFYQVDGQFFTESHHIYEDDAIKRTAYINEQKLVSYDPDEE
jgi:hypothetical protein